MRDALLMAGKDLRLEWRSRVLLGQVLPFAGLALLLFGFALDPDRGVLRRAAPGLFWVTVLLSAVLAATRSVADDGTPSMRDALRLSGLDPSAVFLGKVAAVSAQLLVLEALLAVGVGVIYGAHLAAPVALVATAVLASLGLAAAGTAYGMLAAALRDRDTLLPLLFLPAAAPVLLAATRASELSLGTAVSAVDTGDWLALLAVFAAAYVGLGALAFGSLMEDV